MFVPLFFAVLPIAVSHLPSLFFPSFFAGGPLARPLQLRSEPVFRPIRSFPRLGLARYVVGPFSGYLAHNFARLCSGGRSAGSMVDTCGRPFVIVLDVQALVGRHVGRQAGRSTLR